MALSEGRSASPSFECRIGHTLDVPDLLIAKEERLEHLLWAAITLMQELGTLLEDLAAHEVAHGHPTSSVRAYQRRAERARADAAAIREVIRASHPIDLARVEPGAEGNGEPALRRPGGR